MVGHSDSVPFGLSNEANSGNACASDKRTTDVSAETSGRAVRRFVPVAQSSFKWN
jgi:hypothetical protein